MYMFSRNLRVAGFVHGSFVELKMVLSARYNDVGHMDCVRREVLPLQPKYNSGHPEDYLFLL